MRLQQIPPAKNPSIEYINDFSTAAIPKFNQHIRIGWDYNVIFTWLKYILAKEIHSLWNTQATFYEQEKKIFKPFFRVDRTQPTNDWCHMDIIAEMWPKI